MKKHDDGYVLPYVMVIMTVLAMVAAFLMSSALRNLQSQQASIERMEDQYVAEGEIEKVVALLESGMDPEVVAQKCEDEWENVTFDPDNLTLVAVVDDVEIRCVLAENEGRYTYTSYEITTTAGGADDET